MKTEAEIYKACIFSGVKAGDLVRMSDGKIGFVFMHEPDRILVCETDRSDTAYRTFVSDHSHPRWPTHFASPVFKAGGFSYENRTLGALWGNVVYTQFGGTYFHATGEIKYHAPDPLTLEQRIERLEKLQGVEK